MNFKPNDFFIGLQDFFTILVPGGILVIFLIFNTPETVEGVFNKLSESDNKFQLAVLLFYSYIFGHVLKRIGRILDKIYDKLMSSKNSDLLEEVKKHKKDDYPNLSNYEWARFLLLESNSSYVNEVEIDMISSKFFRTLVICIIPILIYYIVVDNSQTSKLLIIIGLVMLILFSFYQYLYLRKKSVEKTYKYAIYSIKKAKEKND
ncbi:hypothetical protein [Seonamhaeicola sp.]|uniref:hypothetical protein n=1 Tax=Seonamhaeicola sp. TaxID=1912245 RepID=UPI00263954B5|nr:hypothetical protein [Seonamhaeicola sp.]